MLPNHITTAEKNQIKMAIDGKVSRDLQDALLDAFSDTELQRLVRTNLDKNLDAITSAQKNLSDKIFELVEWADRYGRLEELISAAYNENPENAKLKQFVDAEKIRAKPKKIQKVIEEFKIHVHNWQNDGLFESREKLDRLFEYRKYLDLKVNELKFIILSELGDSSGNAFSALFSRSKRSKHSNCLRWLNEAPTTVNLELLNDLLEMYNKREISESFIEEAISVLCQIKALEFQKNLISRFDKHQDSNATLIYTKAYRTSKMPNSSTLSYLQDIATSEQQSVATKKIITYRLLEHYGNKYSRLSKPSFGAEDESVPNLNEYFPVELLNEKHFREEVFGFVTEGSFPRMVKPFKVELLGLLHKTEPEKVVKMLWQIVNHYLEEMGNSLLVPVQRPIELLIKFDPDVTISKVTEKLNKQWCLAPEFDFELIKLLPPAQKDRILVNAFEKYISQYGGGSQRWVHPQIPYHRQSILSVVQFVSSWQPEKYVSYLEAIIVGYEPAKLKSACFKALYSIEKYSMDSDILICLLGDRFAQTRNMASKHLLQTRDHDEILVTKLSRSIVNQPKKEHTLQPTRHDALRSKVQTLCKLRLSAQSSTKTRIDVLTYLANNDDDSQIRQLASDSLTKIKSA